MDGWMDRWMDGWMDETHMHMYIVIKQDSIYKYKLIHTLVPGGLIQLFTSIAYQSDTKYMDACNVHAYVGVLAARCIVSHFVA